MYMKTKDRGVEICCNSRSADLQVSTSGCRPEGRRYGRGYGKCGNKARMSLKTKDQHGKNSGSTRNSDLPPVPGSAGHNGPIFQLAGVSNATLSSPVLGPADSLQRGRSRLINLGGCEMSLKAGGRGWQRNCTSFRDVVAARLTLCRIQALKSWRASKEADLEHTEHDHRSNPGA